MTAPTFEFFRIRNAAARLGHELSEWAATAPDMASAECIRPGCGMGVSLAPAGACGSAVTFRCPGAQPVAESKLA
jgi:hypothetical protein